MIDGACKKNTYRSSSKLSIYKSIASLLIHANQREPAGTTEQSPLQRNSSDGGGSSIHPAAPEAFPSPSSTREPKYESSMLTKGNQLAPRSSLRCKETHLMVVEALFIQLLRKLFQVHLPLGNLSDTNPTASLPAQ